MPADPSYTVAVHLKSDRLFVGIDPGVGGGIAVLREDGYVVKAVKMPETYADILWELTDLPGHLQRAVLERVSASPQMGVVSAFTFGRGYGALEMALTAVHVPFDLVTPRKWQQYMVCLTGGDKNVSKRRAQQIFPEVKITHAVADSLLLAEYCRQQWRGTHHVKESESEVQTARA